MWHNLTVRRTDLQDTSAWAHRTLIELHRKMTPAERLQAAIRMSEEMRRFREATKHLRP